MLFPHLPVLRYPLPDGTLPVVVLVLVSGPSVVDVYWWVVFHPRHCLQLKYDCSSSGPDFHFHQLIPVAFVVAHVVY